MVKMMSELGKETGFSYIPDKRLNWYSSFGNSFGNISYNQNLSLKPKYILPCDSAIPLHQQLNVMNMAITFQYASDICYIVISITGVYNFLTSDLLKLILQLYYSLQTKLSYYCVSDPLIFKLIFKCQVLIVFL